MTTPANHVRRYLVLVVTQDHEIETTYLTDRQDEANRLMMVSMDSECVTAAVVDVVAGETVAQIRKP